MMMASTCNIILQESSEQERRKENVRKRDKENDYTFRGDVEPFPHHTRTRAHKHTLLHNENHTREVSHLDDDDNQDDGDEDWQIFDGKGFETRQTALSEYL